MRRRSAIKNGFKTMLGVSLSASIWHSLSGCNKTSSKVSKSEQEKTLYALADLIVPSTSTPGALEVGAAERIFEVIENNYENPELEAFYDGLEKMDAFANTTKKSSYYKLPKNDQISLLNRVFTKDTNPIDFGNFFALLKALVLYTYFNSIYVREKILAYDPIPGSFNGDIPLDEVGMNWSLS